MKKMKYLPILIALSAVCAQSNAQCVSAADDCSNIQLIMPSGPVNLCAGMSYTFTPTVNYPPICTPTNFLWSPTTGVTPSAGITPSLTTITPTGVGTFTYNLTVNGLGPNIVMNGDFSLGNMCFNTSYTLASPVDPLPQTYNVAHDLLTILNPPWNTYCSPGLTGSPNMMVVNGDILVSHPIVWEEILNVCKGSQYTFSMNLASWSGPMPVSQEPQIAVYINGSLITPAPTTNPFTIPTSCNWYNVTYSWVATSGTADIQIKDLDGQLWYNDFVMDNISFRRNLSTTASITIIDDSCKNPCSDSCYWKVTGNNIIGGNNIFGTLTNDDINIISNNTQRAIIQAGGNMGIRQLVPSTTLDVDCTPLIAPSGLQFENLPLGQGYALVVDNAGYVYVSRSALMPVSGAPDVQSQMDDLKQQIAELKAQLSSLGTQSSSGSGNSLSATPNPSNGAINVNYSIAGTFGSAVVSITDVDGRQIISKPLYKNSGTENIILPASIASGNCLISLIVDGRQVVQQKEALLK